MTRARTFIAAAAGLLAALGLAAHVGCPRASEDGQDHADHEGHDHGDHSDHAEATVELSDTAAANLGLEMARLRARPWYDEVKIPGLLQEEFDRRADVTAPCQVRIVALDAPPHATVRAGQQLAVLELVDADLTQTQLAAVQARADWLKASTELDRTRAYRDGLSGDAMAAERARVIGDIAVLEAEVQASRSTLDAALAAAGLAGLSRTQLDALENEGRVATRVIVHAPALDGRPDLEIAARPVNHGETVEAGSPLFELVALDRLLVVGEAFENELAVVRKATEEKLPVSLYFPAENRSVGGLSLRSIEGVLDGNDRVTHFFVSLPNEVVSTTEEDGERYVDWTYRVGSRVQVLVATEDKGPRFLLPASAVVREEGHSYAYRRHGDVYEQVELRVEKDQGHFVVVPLDSGLVEGDQVVVVGANQVHLSARPEVEGGAGGHAGHGHAH